MRNSKIGKTLSMILFGLGLAGVISVARGVTTAEVQKDRILCLCDGFSMSGLLLLCVGLLVVIAGEGVFDVLSYGVQKGLHHFIPRYTADDLGTFYDYKMAKQKKPKARPVTMLLVGASLLLIGIVLMLLWYSME